MFNNLKELWKWWPWPEARSLGCCSGGRQEDIGWPWCPWSWNGSEGLPLGPTSRLNLYLSSDPTHTLSPAKALDGGEGPSTLFLQPGVQWIHGILFTSLLPQSHRLRAVKAPPQTQDSSSGGSGA